MIYKHKFEVGIEDINKDFKISNKAILKFLDNSASLHSISINKSIEKILKNKLTWFLIEWDLKVIKRAKYNDVVEVHTWCKNKDDGYAYLDFELFVNKKKLAIATSKWILYNTASKKVEKVTKEYIDNYLPEDKDTIKNEELEEIETFDNYDSFKEVVIRKSDLDFNNHLHNLSYLDLVDELVKDNEVFDSVRIIYKKEIKLNDKITVYRKDEKSNVYFLIKDKKDITHAVIKYKKST